MTRAALAVAALSLGLAACGPPPEPTFANVQARVFTKSCAFSTCHGAFLPEEGMSLSEGQAYGAVVNVESRTNPGRFRVVPSDPDDSVLYQALLGPVGPDLDRMPNDRPALDAERIQLVREWIEQGAQEN
jgi:hypothetical protein